MSLFFIHIGTGKSTKVNLAAKIFNKRNVTTIGNDTQPVFGLMNMTKDTYIWVAPEVKQDFSLDQAQFQSLVTAESMSINRKQLGALEESFQCPGYLASNTVPQKWIDNGT